MYYIKNPRLQCKECLKTFQKDKNEYDIKDTNTDGDEYYTGKSCVKCPHCGGVDKYIVI